MQWELERLHCDVSSRLITEGLAARMSASKAEFRERVFSRFLERTHLGDFLMEFLIGHALFMLRRRSGATSLRSVIREESMSKGTPNIFSELVNRLAIVRKKENTSSGKRFVPFNVNAYH